MIHFALFILCAFALYVWYQVGEHARHAVIISILTAVAVGALNNTIQDAKEVLEQVKNIYKAK